MCVCLDCSTQTQVEHKERNTYVCTHECPSVTTRESEQVSKGWRGVGGRERERPSATGSAHCLQLVPGCQPLMRETSAGQQDPSSEALARIETDRCPAFECACPPETQRHHLVRLCSPTPPLHALHSFLTSSLPLPWSMPSTCSLLTDRKSVV